MNREEKQALHGMSIDDAYVVERQLAHGIDGVTELVSLDAAGPFVRKRIPLASVRRMVWAALAECENPYLPRVHSMYELPDEFVAVCDYVPGETLEQVMERRGHLPLAEVAPIVANVCEAVAELHAHGVVHADIAPRNVVLAEDGAHLIDFGIARMVFDKPKRDEKAWGTRGFAAPEQHGFAAVDVRSDIYAIGRLAGYLLTGAVLAKKTFEGELRCSGLVPEGVCQVLGRACAFEPSSRYQNVEDFATAFAAACAGGAVPAIPGTFPGNQPAYAQDAPNAKQPASYERQVPVQRTERFPAHRKVIMLAFTALAVVCACAAIYLLVKDDPSPSISQQGDKAQALTDSSAGRSDMGVPYVDGTDGASSDLADRAASGLVITESTWYMSNGYVHFAIAITNTTEDVLALFPTVVVTGRAADGSILFSSDEVLNDLYPGETRYWGSIAGDGSSVPDTVEFSVSRPGDWEVQAAVGEPSRLTISNVSRRRGQFSDLVVTGEVTLESLSSESMASQVQVVAIGRDSQGDMVFGFMGYTSLPAEGETVPFEVSSSDGLPEFETIEVYAYGW